MWIFFIFCLWNINTAKCDSVAPKTFGSSIKYICHCEGDLCDNKGNCIGSSNKCKEEWFGLACQYQNLAYSFKLSVLPVEANDLFSNNDESKCDFQTLQRSISIEWNMSLPFTWMRIKVSDTKLLTTLNVVFTDDKSSTIPCSKQTIFEVSSNVFDIVCDVPFLMKSLQIQGDIVQHLCYVNVNGGRNLALFQSTSQSSTWENSNDFFGSQLAVDSVLTDVCTLKCSHTQNQSLNTWSVTFDKSYFLNNFVLFNRFDKNRDNERLMGFNLKAFTSNIGTVFNYTEGAKTVQSIYTMVNTGKQPVKKVEISLKNFLTINEFQAYGDCQPGSWGLECNGTCNDSCKDACSTENGLCSICFGYMNPPLCTTDCPDGYYGINCKSQCTSSHCKTCNKMDGNCKLCQPGWTGQTCDTTCDNGTYGLNCTGVCSQHCNSTCDKINGACSCKPGYVGITCSQVCHKDSYGLNCTNKCSGNCVDNTCDAITGKCLSCKPGYHGEYCDIACAETYFGSNCNEKCSTQCFQSICDSKTGKCLNCALGFKGDFCNIKKCPLHCLNGTCDVYSGKCLACRPGYGGDFCDRSDRSSDVIESSVAIGVGVGVGAAVVLLVVIGIVLCKRRVQQPKRKSEAGVENVVKSQDEDHYDKANPGDHFGSDITLDHYDIVLNEEKANDKANESQYEMVPSQNQYDKLTLDIEDTKVEYQKILKPKYENISIEKQCETISVIET